MNAAGLMLLKLLARLPLPVLHGLGIALGWLIYWAPGRHSARMRNNVFDSGLCVPGRDCRRLLRQSVSESGKAIIELLPVWLRPYEKVLELVKGRSGWEAIDAARAAGKGIILIGPHIGCFELLNLDYAAQHPFTAMYKPPRKAVLASLMLNGRQRGLATLVPTDLSGVRAQLAALKRHEAIGILPDQVASSGDGVWAPFFGRPAYTPTLVASLQRKTGAAAFFVAAERLSWGRGYHLHAYPLGDTLPEDKTAAAIRINQGVEDVVRRFPAQYLWSYNRHKRPSDAPDPDALRPAGAPRHEPSKTSLLRPALLPVWLGVGVLWLLHWLPLPLQAAIGNTLGWLVAQIPSKRRRVGATNLALCFPEVPDSLRRRWLRQTFQASIRAALEYGILWWGSEARVRRLVRIDNPEAARGDGVRPVIWLAPHFVGLDMGGVRLTMDQTIVSMYARAQNPVADHYMRHGRTRFSDIVLIERHQGIKATLQAIKRGLPFYYLPDQDHGRLNAVFAPFFGIPAATVSALPRLVNLTDAQVIPVITRQLSWGRGYTLHFYPPWENFPSGDLDADVARMNAFIEDRIREMPAQYLWLHRRFKTRPDGCASLYD